MRRDDDSSAGAPPAEQAEAQGLPTEQADERGLETEADILRTELIQAQVERDGLEQQLREADERYLRARAELETMRRRMQGEVELAREAGVDSALAPALGVFDDLERALEAATRTADASSIVPGVRAVRESLLRNLAALDVKLVGVPGEQFDPHLHEALTVVPLRDGARPGSIDQVFESGFMQGDRLVRVARVTVFADGNQH